MTESGEDMATLALMQGFEDVWPPDAMAGGTITLRQAKGMTYTSDAGFTVLIRGKDLTYDDDGLPAGGTVTGFSISKNAVVLANMTLTSTDFGAAGIWLFGYDRRNGDFRGPDPYSFVQSAMRGNDVVTGSSDGDDIRGGSGNDRIDARGGNDFVADWSHHVSRQVLQTNDTTRHAHFAEVRIPEQLIVWEHPRPDERRRHVRCWLCEQLENRMVCDCLDLSVWHRSTYDRNTLTPVADVPVHTNRHDAVQHQVASLVAPVETRAWEVTCQETPKVAVTCAGEVGRLSLNQRRR